MLIYNYLSLITRICVTCALVACPAVAMAWGPQGHRVAGELAGEYLSDGARSAVARLIGEESLARASTWADRMRSNPSPFWQQQAGPYHYVTVPSGVSYDAVGPPAKGDAVTALAEFRAILLDPEASRARKQLALRFSLHIVQDLHQPMHVGNGRDRGGNALKLVFDSKTTNLHRVWDSTVLNYAGHSDSVILDEVSRLAAQHSRDWQQTEPRVWIAESAALRDTVYPSAGEIDSRYLDAHRNAAVRRLAQSAVRSAAYLNELFARQSAE